MMTPNLLTELVEFPSASGVRITTTWTSGQAMVEIEGCNGDRVHARAWASSRRIAEAPFFSFLNEYACPCDCSILEAAIDGRFEPLSAN